ncbi:MAG TPA: glycine cleavage system aminomethyltransferase GcvT [Acidimicrobiia bacterium]|nr:glycine cleavage system aminomethyltransferase GcvT [Acidimicrobiia bacterium]
MSDARPSPLDAEHRALGGRMVDFAGWDMPIRYGSVLDEHRACRTGAVVFDVSHMGSVWVRGPGAVAALQGLLTNDLGRIAVGRAQYTHLLDDEASVVDDLIVWWVTPEELLVIPNASNTAAVLPALERAAAGAPGGADVEHVTERRALLAVQGPEARRRLSGLAPAAAAVAHFGVATTTLPGGAAGLVGGTGYTGEDGVELFVPVEAATGVWRALLEAGITPAGLGARDTLRLEMGYPLHGHELGPGITPLQAGLGWVVGWDKSAFAGRDALVAERERGPARKLAGILLADRQVPRAGCAVRIGGEPAGEVTSGNVSPMLERGIALAFLPPGTAPGTPVEIDIRGRAAAGEVVKPPFIKPAA